MNVRFTISQIPVRLYPNLLLDMFRNYLQQIGVHPAAVALIFVACCGWGTTDSALATCGDYLHGFDRLALRSHSVLGEQPPEDDPSPCAHGRCSGVPNPHSTTQGGSEPSDPSRGMLGQASILVGQPSELIVSLNQPSPGQPCYEPAEPPPKS